MAWLAFAAYISIGYGSMKCVIDGRSRFAANCPGWVGHVVVMVAWPVYVLINLGYLMVSEC